MLRTMRTEMAPFLGFKDCSIMFFSEEKNSLYTITENKNSDDMEEEMNLYPVERREGQTDEDYDKLLQLQRERIKK